MMKPVFATLAALTLLSANAMATEVKFVTEATYPPFEFMTDKNEFSGFDVELAQAVCAEAKLTCTFSNQAFDSPDPQPEIPSF